MSHLNQLNQDLQATLEKMKNLQKSQKESLEKIHSVKEALEKNKTTAPPKTKL